VATLTIRELDDELRARLRLRAASHGRSMEAEVREILRAALAKAPNDDKLGSRIRHRFAVTGGADLVLPARAELPRSAELA
jgi:antitoxin FitA